MKSGGFILCRTFENFFERIKILLTSLKKKKKKAPLFNYLSSLIGGRWGGWGGEGIADAKWNVPYLNQDLGNSQPRVLRVSMVMQL